MINTINMPAMRAENCVPFVDDQRFPCITVDEDLLTYIGISDDALRIPRTALEMVFSDSRDSSTPGEENVTYYATESDSLSDSATAQGQALSSYSDSAVGAGDSGHIVSLCAGTSGGSVLVKNDLSAEKVAPQPPDVLQALSLPSGVPSDDKLAAVAMEVLETGALTPLIKEELKYTIQSRRLAAGKQELTVDFTPPQKQRHMTAEEKERAYKRRVQNREAAQRFRQRQKDEADKLIKKSLRLECSNTTLRAEIRRLSREKDQLLETLKNHLLVCPLGMLAR